MTGFLIAFEGLDQSGKETQAQALRDRLKADGHKARFISFPDYGTSIGEEIARALQGEREYGPDVMQLLFIANRYERKPDIRRWLEGGLVLLCDRYLASSVAYGEAHGLDAAWLVAAQRFLPPPHLTILLDIAPETAVRRKATDRDRYERDLEMLQRVRDSYLRQAQAGAFAEGFGGPDEATRSLGAWLVVDGERPKDEVATDIATAVGQRLARP